MVRACPWSASSVHRRELCEHPSRHLGAVFSHCRCQGSAWASGASRILASPRLVLPAAHLRELARPCIVAPSTLATVRLYVSSPTHLAILLGLSVQQTPNISFNRTR